MGPAMQQWEWRSGGGSCSLSEQMGSLLHIQLNVHSGREVKGYRKKNTDLSPVSLHWTNEDELQSDHGRCGVYKSEQPHPSNEADVGDACTSHAGRLGLWQ